MGLAQFGIAFVAGLLSILSPCVLPLAPIVFATAGSGHRYGALALAAGVTLSFVALGLFLATIGYSLGLDGGTFRLAGAFMLILAGVALATPVLQTRLALAGGPIGTWADARMRGLASHGLFGQFGVGLLLGAVWSPCAGPTLGAAAALAAQGRSLGVVALTMAAFGFGAALPLGFVGLASRAVLMKWRGALLLGAKPVKTMLGVLLLGLGATIVAGLDRPIETWLVDASPDWLTRLTTTF